MWVLGIEPSPLEEKPVLFTAELSLQPLALILETQLPLCSLSFGLTVYMLGLYACVTVPSLIVICEYLLESS